jgi:hypothetical protein
MVSVQTDVLNRHHFFLLFLAAMLLATRLVKLPGLL